MPDHQSENSPWNRGYQWAYWNFAENWGERGAHSSQPSDFGWFLLCEVGGEQKDPVDGRWAALVSDWSKHPLMFWWNCERIIGWMQTNPVPQLDVKNLWIFNPPSFVYVQIWSPQQTYPNLFIINQDFKENRDQSDPESGDEGNGESEKGFEARSHSMRSLYSLSSTISIKYSYSDNPYKSYFHFYHRRCIASTSSPPTKGKGPSIHSTNPLEAFTIQAVSFAISSRPAKHVEPGISPFTSSTKNKNWWSKLVWDNSMRS